MNLKIGEMKSKGIVNGIFIIGIFYFVILIVTILSDSLIISGTTGDSPLVIFNHIMYIIRTVSLPILGVCLLKLICELLYKIVKAAEILIDRNNE